MLDEKKKAFILAMAECDLNEAKVARVMHYHRNNVVYHCERIYKETGLDPNKFYDLVKLLEMVKAEEADHEHGTM